MHSGGCEPVVVVAVAAWLAGSAVWGRGGSEEEDMFKVCCPNAATRDRALSSIWMDPSQHTHKADSRAR
jgi:hypothetical protein